MRMTTPSEAVSSSGTFCGPLVQDASKASLFMGRIPVSYFYVKILDSEKKGQILLRQGDDFSPSGIPKMVAVSEG